MKRTVVAFIACAGVAAGASFAFAQQDPINSAPSYSPSTGGAPSTSTKINDGINGAPNYNAATAAAAPKAKAAKRQAASVKSTQQHAHHHKHHTPAS